MIRWIYLAKSWSRGAAKIGARTADHLKNEQSYDSISPTAPTDGGRPAIASATIRCCGNHWSRVGCSRPMLLRAPQTPWRRTHSVGDYAKPTLIRSPGTDNIYFNIPASNAPGVNVPVPGFDPTTQDWTITLTSPFPTIIRPVAIDGYTQANAGNPIPYLYPDSISSAVQTLSLLGSPTGGTFTLSTAALLPVGTTAAIPYTADAPAVQYCPDGDYRCW